MQDQSYNPYVEKPAVERVNDQCDGREHRRRPYSDHCFCGARKWIKTKYRRHQNGREQMRRLRQLHNRQLVGNAATPEALATVRRIELISAVQEAERACFDQLIEVPAHYGTRAVVGRKQLYAAVFDLLRFLKDSSYDTATSTLVRDLPASAPSGDGDDDLGLD